MSRAGRGAGVPLAAACLAAGLLAPALTSAGGPEIELGVESFSYRTAETPLNRGELLGLDPWVELLRGVLHVKQAAGGLRAVLRGYAERSFGASGDDTRVVARQAYLQYAWGSGLSLRVGKQRIAWGSGFAWNPSNRLEPPKNPLNPGLEQEGARAARMDWQPVPWAGVILAAAEGDTSVRDLPFDAPEQKRRTGAVRARFLVKDTDLALVASGGKNARSLVGLDLARELGGLTLHAEAALQRGSEIAPPRDDETFLRVAAGVLRASGETTLSLEYFYNGEGYSDAAMHAYLRALDVAWAASQDPRLPPAAQQAAFDTYLAAAAVPFAGGMGLRRHYLQAAATRGAAGGAWSWSARGVVGLQDGGVALTPGVTYAPRGNLTLQLDAILLLGPNDSEFRLAPVRGSLQARARLLF